MKEAVVSGATNFGRGSKRRVRQVRWTRAELISAGLVLLALATETICIALWLMGHSFD
jgi:hypothetical protein